MWNPYRNKPDAFYDSEYTLPYVDSSVFSPSVDPLLSESWLPSKHLDPGEWFLADLDLPSFPSKSFPDLAPLSSIELSPLLDNGCYGAAPFNRIVEQSLPVPPPKKREWTPEQQRRLAFEESVIAQKLGHFTFHDKTGETYVAGWERPRNGLNSYRLRLPIPADCPNTLPCLFVTAPCPLKRYGGHGTISEGSHSDHVLSVNAQGHVKICHTRVSEWHSGRSLFGVLFRGLIWLDCYEEYLRTGRSIGSLIQKMGKRCE